jgi:hypothetical protein
MRRPRLWSTSQRGASHRFQLALKRSPNRLQGNRTSNVDLDRGSWVSRTNYGRNEQTPRGVFANRHSSLIDIGYCMSLPQRGDDVGRRSDLRRNLVVAHSHPVRETRCILNPPAGYRSGEAGDEPDDTKSDAWQRG